jgi:hypothetical protein
MMQAADVPSDLNELEILVGALAKSLNIAPTPSYLDMYGGNSRDHQPIDHHRDMLLGLLDSGTPSGSTN